MVTNAHDKQIFLEEFIKIYKDSLPTNEQKIEADNLIIAWDDTLSKKCSVPMVENKSKFFKDDIKIRYDKLYSKLFNGTLSSLSADHTETDPDSEKLDTTE